MRFKTIALFYKRQMDMYQWILRRKGFEVSPVGYFVYVDGLHVGVPGMLAEDPTGAVMQFQQLVVGSIRKQENF